jgi:hypothetical protein
VAAGRFPTPEPTADPREGNQRVLVGSGIEDTSGCRQENAFPMGKFARNAPTSPPANYPAAA